MSFWSGKRVLVTGGAGFLGSVVVDRLVRSRGVSRDDISIPRSKDSDLRDWQACKRVTRDIDVVIHLAARVGGIGFNQRYPATLFYDNALMGIQVIEAARLAGVSKFVTVGTVCAYPKFTPVPFAEADLWMGYPEETNAPYGLAKKVLLVQAQAYRSQYGFNAIYLLPANLYGPGDSFDEARSHVIPAMIKKFIDGKEKKSPEVRLWGTGTVSREFLFVEDAAEGILLATERYNEAAPVNLGTGKEILIRDLAKLIAELVGYSGRIAWDSSRPDGQPRRRLGVEKAKASFGFEASVDLREGLHRTILWYESNQGQTPAATTVA